MRHTALMERGRELPFELKTIGHCLAEVPDQPAQVGPWMMERLHTREKIEALPKRAKARLKTMYELGIVPYDLVLYHEIKPARRPSALATWASQDLPVIAEKAGEQVVRHGPGILKAIALVTWQMLVLFGFMLLILVMAIARDPVLVVVTEDGYWIEVDRWYS